MASSSECWDGPREVCRGPRDDSWEGFLERTHWESFLKWATPVLVVLVWWKATKNVSYLKILSILNLCKGIKTITWVSGSSFWGTEDNFILRSSRKWKRLGCCEGHLTMTDVFRCWEKNPNNYASFIHAFHKVYWVSCNVPSTVSVLYAWDGRGRTFSLALIMVSN